MTTSTFDSAETPSQPAADAAGAKFTEKQALDWLTDNPKPGTVREIAAIWGWSRSTTQRFLMARVGQGHGTSMGQDANFAETRGTSGTAREAAEGEGRVLGRTPSGTVVAAMPDASDLADGPPIARAPYSDDFDWSPENEDIIVAQQQAIAVYRNAWNQVVIRAAGEDDYSEDVFIRVSPEHVPALIAKLTAIMKEGG
jgi:hypothetical protein